MFLSTPTEIVGIDVAIGDHVISTLNCKIVTWHHSYHKIVGHPVTLYRRLFRSAWKDKHLSRCSSVQISNSLGIKGTAENMIWRNCPCSVRFRTALNLVIYNMPGYDLRNSIGRLRTTWWFRIFSIPPRGGMCSVVIQMPRNIIKNQRRLLDRTFSLD